MMRESILEKLVSKIEAIPEILMVSRKAIVSPQELDEIPVNSFPVVNIIGGLPTPKNGKPIEVSDEPSSIRSVLNAQIRIFGNNSDDPDTEISTLEKILYRNLYYDGYLKGYTYTTRSISVDISEDDIIYTVENASVEATKWKYYKSLNDIGVVADLTTLDYTDTGEFTDMTDSLAKNALSVSITPSVIVEHDEPYFFFMLILTVEFNHKTYEI